MKRPWSKHGETMVRAWRDHGEIIFYGCTPFIIHLTFYQPLTEWRKMTLKIHWYSQSHSMVQCDRLSWWYLHCCWRDAEKIVMVRNRFSSLLLDIIIALAPVNLSARFTIPKAHKKQTLSAITTNGVTYNMGATEPWPITSTINFYLNTHNGR
jgi:hypothetical protein